MASQLKMFHLQFLGCYLKSRCLICSLAPSRDGGLFSRPKLTLYSPTISSWLPDSFIVGSPDSCCNLSTTRYEGCFVLYSLFPRRFFCHHSAQCCVPLALLDGSWQMPSMVSELAWLISHAKGHLLNLILRYL